MERTPILQGREELECMARCEVGNKVPIRWYEHGVVWFGGTSVLAWWLGQLINTHRLPATIWLSVAALFIYLAGTGLDFVSTLAVFRHSQAYKGLGLEMPIREGNWFVSKQPTLREILLSAATVLTILLVPISFLVPPLGLAIGIGRAGISMSNFRNEQRVKMHLGISDSRGREK